MAPQVFSGKYVVQEEIAKGGMGVIYKALDRTLNRVVAIKLVHAHLSGDSSFVERFLANVVTVIECDGALFLHSDHAFYVFGHTGH